MEGELLGDGDISDSDGSSDSCDERKETLEMTDAGDSGRKGGGERYPTSDGALEMEGVFPDATSRRLVVSGRPRMKADSSRSSRSILRKCELVSLPC